MKPLSSWCLLGSFALFACGGNSGPFVVAAHTALPQISRHAGVVLTSPQIVTVTFPGYAHRSRVEALGDFIGGSAWLHAAGAEYGVGVGSHLAKVVWPTAAPASFVDQDLRKMLTQGMKDGTLPVPPASNNNVVYVVYIPSTSILDASAFGAGVMCFRASLHSAGGAYTAGYHDSIATPAGGVVPFIAIGDCSNDENEITAIASRELIGAATNPYEVQGSGWLLDTTTDDPWVLNLNNGELGYMCSEELPVHEAGFALNRSWSNAAAAASQTPCVPTGGDDAYFNVSAAPSTTATVAAGTTVTFALTGWSSAPVAAWKLKATKPEGSDFTLAQLAPVFSTQVINNAEAATLTLTVPASARSAQTAGVDISSGDPPHVWPVAFTVK